MKIKSNPFVDPFYNMYWKCYHHNPAGYYAVDYLSRDVSWNLTIPFPAPEKHGEVIKQLNLELDHV